MARSRLLRFLALPILSLAAPAAHAALGFTGTFDPETWLVVNTTAGVTDQTLSYSGAAADLYGCFGSTASQGTNEVACVDSYTATGINNEVVLFGSTEDLPGGLTGSEKPRSSTLVFTNNYWRPYLVSFDWSFTQYADPSNLYVENGQNVSFLVNPGFISPNGGSGTTYSFTSVPGVAYQNSTGWVAYVPPGATLSFSINTTDNDGDRGVLIIKGFTTTEVPAPLPIAGSSAVLLYSRRLRRRTRKAASQPPALHPSTGKVLSLAQQRSSHKKHLALSHYGTMLGGPVLSGLPTSPPTHKI